MFEIGWNVFPRIAREGLQVYSENVESRFELNDRIMQGIREGNEFQALEALRERNKMQLPGRLQNELTEMKYDLIRVETRAIQIMRKNGVPDLSLDSIETEYEQKIERAETIEECKKISEQMIRRLCSVNQIKPVQKYSLMVQRVMLAVDMDLSQTLTLQYFSEILNVNDSYLSSLFSREVGMTLTEYVTLRRIQRAENLLLTTMLPVKAVAKQVGFSDVHYFSRIFKKRKGITPSEYRSKEKESL